MIVLFHIISSEIHVHFPPQNITRVNTIFLRAGGNLGGGEIVGEMEKGRRECSTDGEVNCSRELLTANVYNLVSNFQRFNTSLPYIHVHRFTMIMYRT